MLVSVVSLCTVSKIVWGLFCNSVEHSRTVFFIEWKQGYLLHVLGIALRHMRILEWGKKKKQQTNKIPEAKTNLYTQNESIIFSVDRLY